MASLKLVVSNTYVEPSSKPRPTLTLIEGGEDSTVIPFPSEISSSNRDRVRSTETAFDELQRMKRNLSKFNIEFLP